MVFRAFPTETIVLHLERGLYHGLNEVAGRMLAVLSELRSVDAASERLADEYDQPLDQIQADLCALCRDLLDRDLLVLER